MAVRQTESGNNFERKAIVTPFQRLPQHCGVRTMSDLDMVVPTLPDIDRHPKLKIVGQETGSGNNFEFLTSGYVG